MPVAGIGSLGRDNKNRGAGLAAAAAVQRAGGVNLKGHEPASHNGGGQMMAHCCRQDGSSPAGVVVLLVDCSHCT